MTSSPQIESRQVIQEDREYASELLADLNSGDLPRLEIAARWFRKARVERALCSEAVDIGQAADTLRDQFEAWASQDHRNLQPQECEDREDWNNHYYVHDCDNEAFIGWKAALAGGAGTLSPQPNNGDSA